MRDALSRGFRKIAQDVAAVVVVARKRKRKRYLKHRSIIASPPLWKRLAAAFRVFRNLNIDLLLLTSRAKIHSSARK